jgi:Aspartate oxidase
MAWVLRARPPWSSRRVDLVRCSHRRRILLWRRETGLALAIRAGAVVSDLEFVQFHPTVMWLGPYARGQQPLVSEAVRGEGATLVDSSGERFMLTEHPLADLAPRDVVSRAIMRRMLDSGEPHVWLDGRLFGERMWRERFPTIYASCLDHDIDPATELIPVAPASHYVSGGSSH